MYAFAQRKDMKVMDEPFYAVYLKETGFQHPAREDILKSMPLQEDEVLRNILTVSHNSKHLFVKNMASHFLVLTPEKYRSFRTVFLIRDPLRIITSYCKVIEFPTAQDVGIQRQAELFRYFQSQDQEIPLVIDSNDILEQPQYHLDRLCRELGITFDPDMLKWPAGPKTYDGVWAPHWYNHVHRSTRFEKQPSSDDPLPPRLHSLYEESRDAYQFLYKYSLTNPDNAAEI